MCARERVTEEEIKTLIAEAESSGVLEPGEKEMIAGVLRLGDRNVKVVMTPRHDVDTINLSASDDAIFAALNASTAFAPAGIRHAKDEVIGVVQAKELLKPFLAGERPDIRDLHPACAGHPRQRRCARRDLRAEGFAHSYGAGA